MGMFDTIAFDAPIECSNCAAKISSTQTKRFESTLRCFRVGDVIIGSPIVTGVLEEQLYCAACRFLTQKIYVTLWHSLLTGVFLSLEEAESRVFQIDRADILHYLIRHQEQAQTSNARFVRFHGLLHAYQEYFAADNKEAFFSGFGGISRLELKEHLNAEDPLLSILEAHRPPEDEGMF